MPDVPVTLRLPYLCPSEGHKHGIYIQSSTTHEWKTAKTWFLAMLLTYQTSIVSRFLTLFIERLIIIIIIINNNKLIFYEEASNHLVLILITRLVKTENNKLLTTTMFTSNRHYFITHRVQCMTCFQRTETKLQNNCFEVLCCGINWYIDDVKE